MSTYTIVGAGAIGGLVGAALSKAGHDVTFVEANPEHRAAIAVDGLKVTGYCDMTARVPVVAPEDLPAGQERVLLATKSVHTTSAIEIMRDRIAPGGYVASLQNGLNEYALAEAFGPGRVIGAYLTFGGYVTEPGRVTYAGEGSFRVGEFDGVVSKRLSELARDLSALQTCKTTDNIFGYLWAKMVLGAVYYGTAVLDRDVLEIYSDPEALAVLGEAAREATLVARANGVRLADVDGFRPDAFAEGDAQAIAESWEAQRAYWAAHVGSGRTGVWRDLAIHHRKTECSEHVGAVIRRRGSIATPVLDRIAACVAEIEDGKRSVGPDNLAVLAGK